MCSLFTYRQSPRRQHGLLQGIQLPSDLLRPDGLYRPYTMAPAIVGFDGGLQVLAMNFSLVPKWSKEPKVKWATHNARLETIAEKPTFKDAFQERHCLIPMTGFVEPIYTGEYAGNMIEFSNPDEETLYAAAIWEEWTNKVNGEILSSFSIITSNPLPFVEKVGHDRSPLFLSSTVGPDWLGSEGMEPTDLIALLKHEAHRPNLTASIQRPLKAGWEKRIPKD